MIDMTIDEAKEYDTSVDRLYNDTGINIDDLLERNIEFMDNKVSLLQVFNRLPQNAWIYSEAFHDIGSLAQVLLNDKLGRYCVSYTDENDTYYDIRVRVNTHKPVVIDILSSIVSLSKYTYAQAIDNEIDKGTKAISTDAVHYLARIIDVDCSIYAVADMNISLYDAIYSVLKSNVYEFLDIFTFSPEYEEPQGIRYMKYDIIIKSVPNGNIRDMIITLQCMLQNNERNNKSNDRLYSVVQDLFKSIKVTRIKKLR